MSQPTVKPNNPCFSSGPCAKRPGWSLAALEGAYMGRSHRAAGPKARLKEVIEKQRDLLGIPANYKLGIVPASDTGAVEMALWSMLGSPDDGGRGVDVFAWESFGSGWIKDITNELKLDDVRIFEAPYGQIPDLSQADPARDIVFTWNGTTGGACVPNGDWISDAREGITICDATSAVFAYDLPWERLDVTTWSWQKCLGGEAAHGMIALSPRAVQRLEHFKAPRPLPKIFRMLKGGKLNEGIFEGATINTPSMLAVEDCLDALNWAARIGGLPATIKRSQESFEHVKAWVEKTDWIEFLAEAPETRSTTSVQVKITDPVFTALDEAGQWDFLQKICKALENEDVAYDIKAHRDSPPGLRIWCGATIEPDDVAALLPWIDWSYGVVRG